MTSACKMEAEIGSAMQDYLNTLLHTCSDMAKRPCYSSDRVQAE